MVGNQNPPRDFVHSGLRGRLAPGDRAERWSSVFIEVNILGASSGAFDQTPHHALIALLNSGSYERERVVRRPLAHARGYTNQAEASFGASNPSRMNSGRVAEPRVPGTPVDSCRQARQCTNKFKES